MKKSEITEDTEFIFSTPIQSEIRHLLANNEEKLSLGASLAEEGESPKFPALIIPGLGSSAMSVWSSSYCTDWVGERIWIDFAKIGTQISFPTFFEKKIRDSDPDNYGMFVRHMLLADDGVSDPPGIRVRPMEGLEAVACLAPSSRITSGITSIFGPLIRNLLDIGYDQKNLDAAPYDWRLPVSVLEERDGYFTKLKSKVEYLYALNKEKRIVFICHSNGNRVAHYFTNWAEDHYPGWVKKHIHGLIALAAPYLGAPKMARAIITGDALGLDIVMKSTEEEAWGRHMGSYPSLLPLQEQLLPSRILMLNSREEGPKTEEAVIHATNFWKKYHAESEYDDFLDDENLTEITPVMMYGIWHREDEKCEPRVPENDDDYVPNLKGWARKQIFKLILFMDAFTQSYHTAKNGYKEINTLIDGSKKSVSYPFDHEKRIHDIDVQRKSTLSSDGKKIITTYHFPKGYELVLVIAITNAGSNLHKYITITRKNTIIEKLKRVYQRQTPIRALFVKNSGQKIGSFVSPDCLTFIRAAIPASYEHHQEYFEKNPYINACGVKPESMHHPLSDKGARKYPILQPPLNIDNLWCIYGINVETELSYYLSNERGNDAITFVKDADDYSEKVCDNNPAGLVIKGGIAYETKSTPQPVLKGKGTASGDGTVPYCSLSYCKNWQSYDDINVDVIEVEDQEHTDMLKSPEVIYHVLQYLCHGSNKFANQN